MRTIKLADVIIQMHVRDEYSWQRVLYCPWVNCKHYKELLMALLILSKI